MVVCGHPEHCHSRKLYFSRPSMYRFKKCIISNLVNNLKYFNLMVESAKKFDNAVLITHREHIHNT